MIFSIFPQNETLYFMILHLIRIKPSIELYIS